MFNIILPKIRLNIEKWKWNKEYRVYVSNQGHIKNEYKQNIPIKINRSGYCVVQTYCGFKTVHRLVLLTFNSIPNAEDLTIDHLNHNKRDNSLYNLEWVSKIENVKRAKRDFVAIDLAKNNIRIINSEVQNPLTLKEAVEWVIKNKCVTKTNPNLANIEKRILKSINTGEKYCGILWKLENILNDRKE